MKMKRKLIALILSAAMILSLMPAMVFAEDGEEVITPVSVELDATSFYGTVGLNTIENLNAVGQGFKVTYSDGSEKTFIYDEKTFKDESGQSYKKEGFFLDGGDPSRESSILYAYEDPNNKVFKEGLNTARVYVNAPYVTRGAGTDQEVVDAKRFALDVNVYCNPDKLLKVEFRPAGGFTPDAKIGYNYLTEDSFYGSGNAFVVTYEYKYIDADGEGTGQYVVEYKYVRKQTSGGDVIEGFYESGNTDEKRFNFDEGVDCILNKGHNSVTFSYSEIVAGQLEPATIKFTVDVVATRYDAYGNIPVFDYTGKAITKKAFAKKLVVRDSLGRKIPASAYTYTLKKTKKIGWYTVEIKFKDKTKYVDSIIESYGIGPKTPKIKKVTGGKKQLTVTWKKFTKKQLKYIDGAYIEVATDKHFLNGMKRIKVSKKQLTKNRKVIKKLGKKKKYYVRMYTYKKIKQKGEKFEMWSSDSKTKIKKTK